MRPLFIAALLLPTVAFAAPRTFQELAGSLTGLLNATTGVLIVAGLAIYFWGISVNILNFHEDREKFRNYFFWGVIVLFVMVSVWGIVALVQNTLFGGSSGSSSVPSAQQPGQYSPPQFLE